MSESEPIVFKLIGNYAQILEISIEPNKAFLADGGMLLYLDEEITLETRIDDGYTPPKIETPAPEPEPEPKPAKVAPVEQTPAPVVEEPPARRPPVEEEEDTEGTFLEKLWKATRKTISHLGGKKKETPAPAPVTPRVEPTPAPSTATGFGGVFDEPAEETPAPAPAPEEPETPAFSWYITHLHNPSEYIRKVGFTMTQGGLAVPVMLDSLEGNAVIFQTGSFICARKGVRLEKFLDTEISLNFTEGKLFKLDKITGHGMIFLRGEGQVICREMENDAIRLNLFALLAYESTLTLDTENLTLTDSMNYEDKTQFVLLSGTGRYWIQTATLQHLVYRLSPVMFEPEPDVPPAPEVLPEETPAKEEAAPEQVPDEAPEPPKEQEAPAPEEAPKKEVPPADAPADDAPDLDIDRIVEEL